ncbi:MAG: peptidyl-prolyl cis-trans isomerase [Candidatus Xenobia bacterium]
MIANDIVVEINYTLRDQEGKILDQTREEPLAYLHGHQNLIPGFEKQMTGMQPGEKKSFTVEPKDGYGEVRADLRFGMKKADFGGHPIKEGAMVGLQGPGGETIRARIIEIKGEEVLLDANHPLAGQKLFFEVEVVKLRPGSPEEIAHGHVHGPGGHHHHH